MTKEQGAALIDDHRVRDVALTGRDAGGAVVVASAGQNLKKSTLAVGGSDAFIVLEDVDMARAVKQAVSGRMGNAGQAGTASKRCIVLDAVAEAFLDQFTAAVAQSTPDDPMDAHSTLARLSSAAARDKLEQQAQTAVQRGAKLPLVGQRVACMPGMPGNFMQPTILTDTAEANPMFCGEFFGTVALFFHVPDQAAAVDLANSSPFGPGGSVVTQDTERGRRVARRSDNGMVFVNSAAVSLPDLSFGGVKHSGYSRELSAARIQEFVNKKLIRLA